MDRSYLWKHHSAVLESEVIYNICLSRVKCIRTTIEYIQMQLGKVFWGIATEKVETAGKKLCNL